MERLTKRLPSGAADYNYPKSCYFGDGSGADRIAQSAFRQRCVEQLAEYEDTELTPEEVSALVKDWSDLRTIVGECGGIDRVRALAEADRAGRLVVHGRWIDGKCSNCGVDIPTDDAHDVIFGHECRFCYYCGAKMDGGVDHEAG